MILLGSRVQLAFYLHDKAVHSNTSTLVKHALHLSFAVLIMGSTTPNAWIKKNSAVTTTSSQIWWSLAADAVDLSDPTS